MANLPHSYQLFLFFCRLLLLGSDKKKKKKKLLVHLTMLNLEKKRSVSNLNWIISTNLGLRTIRGGDCDLNVCFPHLHLRNKLVKTFLVSRFVPRNHLVSKPSFIKLVLKWWRNMQKPTCSPGQGLMTQQLPSTLLVNSMLNNSSSLRIICIWNQCFPVLLKKGFPLALAWSGNVFKWHLQLDLQWKSKQSNMLKLTQTFPKTEMIGYITGIMLAKAVRRGIATK